jgi:glutathione S-transferase
MLRIWGLKSAANAQKVTWCLGELDLPYQHVAENALGQAPHDAQYLKLQGHVVPVMDDDGFVLWEAHAIARYLAEKYGRAPFWPASAQGRAEAGRWMDYQLSTVRQNVHVLMRGSPDAAEVARVSRNIADAMQVVEKALERRDYLAGKDFTVGDIPLGIMAFRWSILDVNKPPMPAIDAWFGRLRARPAFQKHIAAHLPEGSYTPLRAGTQPTREPQ